MRLIGGIAVRIEQLRSHLIEAVRLRLGPGAMTCALRATAPLPRAMTGLLTQLYGLPVVLDDTLGLDEWRLEVGPAPQVRTPLEPSGRSE